MLCLKCLAIFEEKLDFGDVEEPGGLIREGQHKQGIDIADSASQGCYVCFYVWDDFLQTEAGKRFRETAVTEHSRYSTWYSLRRRHSAVLLGMFGSLQFDNGVIDVGNSRTLFTLSSINSSYNDPNSLAYIPADNISDEHEESQARSNLVVKEDDRRHMIPLARKWLDICRETHPKCRMETPKLASKTNPAMRLLNIDTNLGQRKVTLCPGATVGQLEGHVQYSTLSHRWGSCKFLTLTKDTFADLTNGISVSLLSQTFQDAVEVTAQMGLKFIWIDSLCIFQDSVTDVSTFPSPRLYVRAPAISR
jgi:hypothetical protein